MKENALIIEGRHDEREDEHGFIRRHFVRKYEIPKVFHQNSKIPKVFHQNSNQDPHRGAFSFSRGRANLSCRLKFFLFDKKKSDYLSFSND